jgi:DNA-binding CsgD family transcriptional regulator
MEISQPLANQGARMPTYRPLPVARRPIHLTKREQTVERELDSGKNNKEIAAVLGIAVGTVKAYLVHLKAKDPAWANRYTTGNRLVRGRERVMAIRLNSWIVAWGDALPTPALSEIKGIMADQVCQTLSGIELPSGNLTCP